ncbi:tryptophan 5-hydroxylase 1 [Saccoglossus kowalevskii]|uniref:Tryptophan 5-hydroxylase 2 n=2 Tax=Saccoglossus kowalevskii TaxID=10224 RepID=A0A0U2K793_SACKO|nr:tryptophan 5-hydroxylase-like 126 [Saccoglossus kowalevskii]
MLTAKKDMTFSNRYNNRNLVISRRDSFNDCVSHSTTPVIFSLKNEVGGLARALKVFKENNVNVVHIESRKALHRGDSEYEIYVDCDSTDGHIHELMALLKNHVDIINMPDMDGAESVAPEVILSEIPWFPHTISDLDKCANRVLHLGAELDADYPDPEYRQRRKYFTELGYEYRHGQPMKRVEYSESETKTWGTVFTELSRLYPTHACREYLENFKVLVEEGIYRKDSIPQLQDVSEFLKARTGFQLRPVAGYLSPRDFLAGLAFRVFHCTQYIRHSSDPLYTKEPDCCHELLGHVPLLADKSFAQFSQEIGLASLGASDEEVQKLATCYFFTVEFGLCKQNGKIRVYGAGLLSSIGELKHALTDKAIIKSFNPIETIKEECMITTYQNCYFLSDSFEEAKEKMREFACTIKRPFAVRYNPYTHSVEVLSNVRRIADVVNELKGDLSVLSSALEKLQS